MYVCTITKNSVFLFLDESGGDESIAVSTLHRSIEKNTTNIISSLFLMTSQRLILFSFPEEMDDLIDFIFVRTFF